MLPLWFMFLNNAFPEAASIFRNAQAIKKETRKSISEKFEYFTIEICSRYYDNNYIEIGKHRVLVNDSFLFNLRKLLNFYVDRVENDSLVFERKGLVVTCHFKGYFRNLKPEDCTKIKTFLNKHLYN